MTPAATTSAAPLAHYRALQPGDVPFLFHSWLKSYRKQSQLPGPAYYEAQHQVVARLLERGQVLVACDPKSPDEVWAWLCFEAQPEGPLLHFVYVKHLFRRFGLASELLRQATAAGCFQTFHTHETPAGKRLAAKYGSTYSPEAAQ